MRRCNGRIWPRKDQPRNLATEGSTTEEAGHGKIQPRKNLAAEGSTNEESGRMQLGYTTPSGTRLPPVTRFHYVERLPDPAGGIQYRPAGPAVCREQNSGKTWSSCRDGPVPATGCWAGHFFNKESKHFHIQFFVSIFTANRCLSLTTPCTWPSSQDTLYGSPRRRWQ